MKLSIFNLFYLKKKTQIGISYSSTQYIIFYPSHYSLLLWSSLSKAKYPQILKLFLICIPEDISFLIILANFLQIVSRVSVSFFQMWYSVLHIFLMTEIRKVLIWILFYNLMLNWKLNSNLSRGAKMILLKFIFNFFIIKSVVFVLLLFVCFSVFLVFFK